MHKDALTISKENCTKTHLLHLTDAKFENRMTVPTIILLQTLHVHRFSSMPKCVCKMLWKLVNVVLVHRVVWFV